MSGPPPGSSESPWSWVTDPGTDLCGCLTFVRGISPQRLIEGFGMDPDAARLLPRDRAGEAVRYPVRDQRGPTGYAVIRAGQAGEWAFAFEDAVTEAMTTDGHAVGLRLSAGTDAVVVSWNPAVETVDYLANGDVVTRFEPLGAAGRSGTGPDRFLPQMRQAGLLDEPAGQNRFDTFRPLVAALDMLTLALGIRLTREMIEGPLLTVQRAPGAQLPG